eukprot:m.83044 g.83044  ORF g.83044 m.83044 type:complete len:354 (-) comp14329_c0_seq1:705-1766(-)
MANLLPLFSLLSPLSSPLLLPLPSLLPSPLFPSPLLSFLPSSLPPLFSSPLPDTRDQRTRAIEQPQQRQEMASRSNPVVGFVGCGKMAQAMMRGMIQGFVTPADHIHAFDVSDDCIKVAKEEIGVRIHTSNVEVANAADVVVIAVKPDVVPQVLKEIATTVGTQKLVVSIAAGVKLAIIQKNLQQHARIVRVMPNTPALVREGATAIAADPDATPEDIDLVQDIMSAVGTCVRVKEKQMDAVTGLSGSGPAYGYMFIEALADGGVRAGLTRREAQLLAAQTVLGAAKMVLETGLHPGELKDQVCSPNGTTIAAVHALEKAGVRGSIIDAVMTAAKRAEEIGAILDENPAKKKK